jgi:hypothetical protein
MKELMMYEWKPLCSMKEPLERNNKTNGSPIRSGKKPIEYPIDAAWNKIKGTNAIPLIVISHEGTYLSTIIFKFLCFLMSNQFYLFCFPGSHHSYCHSYFPSPSMNSPVGGRGHNLPFLKWACGDMTNAISFTYKSIESCG